MIEQSDVEAQDRKGTIKAGAGALAIGIAIALGFLGPAGFDGLDLAACALFVGGVYQLIR